jgi:hypothetical protein
MLSLLVITRCSPFLADVDFAIISILFTLFSHNHKNNNIIDAFIQNKIVKKIIYYISLNTSIY